MQDHNFHTQAVFEIQREIGKLETGLGSIETRLAKLETKVDSIATQLTTLTSSVNTVKPLFLWAVRGVWAMIAGLVVFGLSVFAMWLRHYFGW